MKYIHISIAKKGNIQLISHLYMIFQYVVHG